MIVVSSILTTIVFAVAVFFFISPKYQSTTQMIVNQKINKNIQETQMQQLQQADVQLVNTYKSIVTSPAVSSEVQSKMGNSKLAQKSQVSVNTQPNSQVFDISVKSSNPNVAAQMANSTATVFRHRLKEMMKSSSASVISRAHPDATPVFPKKSLSILAGFFVGIVLGIILALFKEYSAKTIDDLDYVTKDLGLTNLGIVNDINIHSIERDADEQRRHGHDYHDRKNEF